MVTSTNPSIWFPWSNLQARPWLSILNCETVWVGRAMQMWHEYYWIHVNCLTPSSAVFMSVSLSLFLCWHPSDQMNKTGLPGCRVPDRSLSWRVATSVANWSDAQLSDTTTTTTTTTIPQKWTAEFGAKVAMGFAPSATATVTASETCFMQASNEVNAVGTFQLHRVPRSCPRRSCWKCWEGSLRSDNKSGHGCCEYYTMNIYEYCLDTDWILSGYWCFDLQSTSKYP